MSCTLRGLFLLFAALSAAPTSGVSIQDDDPLKTFVIEYPLDGGFATSPLRFKFFVETTSQTVFKACYGDKLICLQLDHATTKCSPLVNSRIRFFDVPEGIHVASAYISESADSDIRYHETKLLSFSIVNVADYDAHIEQQIEQTRAAYNFPPDLGLLRWAQQQQTSNNSLADDFNLTNNGSRLMLVIGVKSAVLKNFARRQAIRETWGSKTALPSNVKVFFLGCTPVMEDEVDFRDRQRLQAAVDLERAVYGDLLTEELGCEDSHSLLAEKMSAFFEWLVAELPQTKFVMIADDDVYMAVHAIVKDLATNVQHKKLYLGELTDNLHPSPLRPIRISSDRYYTSKKSYPLDQFVPYAAGPHFLLSIDCVQFIAKNRRRLASLNGQDDTSIALWLLAVQVHVERTSALTSLRFLTCRDNLLSLADLSPLGIRSIHDNLVHNRSFCHGFYFPSWGWRSSDVPANMTSCLENER